MMNNLNLKLTIVTMFFALMLTASVVPTVKPVQSQGIADEIINDLNQQIYPGQSPPASSQGRGQQEGSSLLEDIISDYDKQIYPGLSQPPQTQQQQPSVGPPLQSQQAQQQQPSTGQSQFQSPQMQQQQPSTGQFNMPAGEICMKNIDNVPRTITSGSPDDYDNAGKAFDSSVVMPGSVACGPFGSPAFDNIHPADNVYDFFEVVPAEPKECVVPTAGHPPIGDVIPVTYSTSHRSIITYVTIDGGTRGDGGTQVPQLEPPSSQPSDKLPEFVCPALPGGALTDLTYKEAMKKLQEIPPSKRGEWMKEVLELNSKRSMGSWQADYQKLADGSHMWTGQYTKDVLVIDAKGTVYRGNLSNPSQFTLGPGASMQPNYQNLGVVVPGG